MANSDNKKIRELRRKGVKLFDEDGNPIRRVSETRPKQDSVAVQPVPQAIPQPVQVIVDNTETNRILDKIATAPVQGGVVKHWRFVIHRNVHGFITDVEAIAQ